MAGSELKFGLLLSVIDRASAPLRGIGSAFTAVGNAGKRLSELGSELRVARENVSDFAQRGEAALRSIIQPTHDVEAAMVSLKPALADVSSDVGASLARVRADAIAWSDQHSQSAAEYLAVTTRMLQAGRSEEEALKGTAIGLRVAAAAKADASGAANTLAIVYDQLGDKTAAWDTELGRIGDALVRARQIYGEGFDVGGLADPLKDAAGAARDARVPAEQVIGLIGAFNKSGILGGEAGAATKNVIEGLQAASSQLGIVLARTKDGGLDVGRTLKGITDNFGTLDRMTPDMLANLQTAFGPAWRDVSLLLNQSQALEGQFRALGDASGTTAAAFADAEGTTGAQLARVNNQMTALKLELAEGVLPAVKEMLPAFSNILTPIGQFVGTHPQLVSWVGTAAVGAVGFAKLGESVASVAGAAASFSGGALKAISATAGFVGQAGRLGLGLMSSVVPAFVSAAGSAAAFAVTLLANPITWIVLAIVAAAALIYVYWEPITKFFSGIWAEIRGAFDKGWVQGILKVIEMFSPVVWIAKGLNAVTEYLFGFSLFDAASGMMSSLLNGLSGWWGTITSAFDQGILQGLATLLSQFSPVAWIAKGLNALTEYLFGYSLFDAGSNIVNTIVSGIQSMASAPVEAMRNVVQRIRNLLPFSPAKDGPLRDLHKVKLVETVADAVRPAPLVDAMSSAAGMAMAAIAAVPPPVFAPLPAVMPGARAGNDNAAPLQMDVTIQLGGGSDRSAVEELEAWLRSPDNARRLAAAVQGHQAREARAGYG